MIAISVYQLAAPEDINTFSIDKNYSGENISPEFPTYTNDPLHGICDNWSYRLYTCTYIHVHNYINSNIS